MVVRVHGGIIDDQMLAGSLRYFDIEEANMTVNTIANGNQQAIAATVVVGGTGYAVGNTLTATTGTGTQATYTVTSVDGGVVTGVSVLTGGDYSVLPTEPIITTGGAGTATLNAEYTSTVIIPGAGVPGGSEFFVSTNKPVTGSAVDQVLSVVQAGGADGGGGTIVQVAIVDVDTVRIAVENTGFGWDTAEAGDAAAEMQAAIRLAGPAANGVLTNVPDTTASGTTFSVALATVTERTFASFAP